MHLEIFQVDGVITAVMLSNTIVLPDDGDAKGLAKSMLKSMSAFVPGAELRSRCAGLAFDGQYICEDVPGELRKLIGGTQKWLTAMWDGAHQLERALHDVREDKTGTIKLATVHWYGPLSDLLAALLKKYQYGKGYEKLRLVSEEEGLKMRNPQTFCATRFNRSEVKVIEGFLLNFKAYAKEYERASSIPAGAPCAGPTCRRCLRHPHCHVDPQVDFVSGRSTPMCPF